MLLRLVSKRVMKPLLQVCQVDVCGCADCRHWVSKNIPLLLDKNPNVRQMAGKSLATIYSIDPHTVSTHQWQCLPALLFKVAKALHVGGVSNGRSLSLLHGISRHDV